MVLVPLVITLSTVPGKEGWGNKNIYYLFLNQNICCLPGPVAHSVTCLATDACLTADPGVASSILARYHTFVEIDHDIISTAILLSSADSFKKDCCQLQANVCTNYWLTAQEKVWLGELTVPPWPRLLTWDVKQENKQNICCGCSKEPSLWDGSFEHPKPMFKLIDKIIITILGLKCLHKFSGWRNGAASMSTAVSYNMV